MASACGVEADALARADQFVQPAAACGDQRGDLVAQNEVLRRGAAQEHDDVGIARELFQQRADRRDADAGTREQHAVAVVARRR